MYRSAFSVIASSRVDRFRGTVKGLAARVNLQLTYREHIITPRQLLAWKKDHMNFKYACQEKIDMNKRDQHLVTQTVDVLNRMIS